MSAICQITLPVAPRTDALAARLLGLQPVAEDDWLRVDDADAAQLAYSDPLPETRRGDVVLHQVRLDRERRPFDPVAPTWDRAERRWLMRLVAAATASAIRTHPVPLEKPAPEQSAGLPETVRRVGSMVKTN